MHVAEEIGVDECSIYNWESNRVAPSLRLIPRIIEFLGYVPIFESSEITTSSLAARLLAENLQQNIVIPLPGESF